MTASTPSSRKDKGRRFQQDVAADLQEVLHMPAADIVSRSMGAPGTDLMLSAAAVAAFPFAIECKRAENLKIRPWWDQAATNAAAVSLLPLLVFRRSREPAYAAIGQDPLQCLLSTAAPRRRPYDMYQHLAMAWFLSRWISADQAASGSDRVAIQVLRDLTRPDLYVLPWDYLLQLIADRQEHLQYAAADPDLAALAAQQRGST